MFQCIIHYYEVLLGPFGDCDVCTHVHLFEIDLFERSSPFYLNVSVLFYSGISHSSEALVMSIIGHALIRIIFPILQN